jgi:phospholipid transport system transporter-binding protein
VSTATAVAPTVDRAHGGVFELLRRAPGHFEARGVLTFASAHRAWEEGSKLLRAEPGMALEVDCAGVRAADSAGLVVLLDWLASAAGAGRTLTYRRLPASILSLAAISDLEELLTHGFPHEARGG